MDGERKTRREGTHRSNENLSATIFNYSLEGPRYNYKNYSRSIFSDNNDIGLEARLPVVPVRSGLCPYRLV